MKPHILSYIILLLTCCIPHHLRAGIEPAVSSYLNGDLFIAYQNSPTFTQNATFVNDLPDFNTNVSPYSFPANQNIRKIENMVQLYLDPDFITYIGFDYELEVTIDIKKYEYNGTGPVSETTKLKINYNPKERTKWIEKANFHFVNSGRIGYKITAVKLTSSKSLTEADKQLVSTVVGLKSEIIIERYFDFIVTTQLTGNQIVNSFHAGNNELTIDWDPIPGAEYYDLEWAFVDDYNGIGGKILPQNLLLHSHYNLNRNSSRVRVTETQYAFPLVFESGYILYRVRGIGMVYESSTDLIYPMPGIWSTESTPNASLWPHKYQISTLQVFVRDSLNWQIITSYAEEGKSKSIIGFRDGTQRNRQTVTGLSTEQQAMVAEQIYDHQGRPAIEILPVPANDPRLKYYKLFNVNAQGKAYNRNNFDTTKYDLIGLCDISADPMHISKGASRYYSPNNPVKTDHHAYIPDAEGYPFVQTEYTPDNTGRIGRQSGVGYHHRLGSKHETKYYYGTPEQEEISALFGIEVGYANHYKKNVVKDPNGQFSVSWLNLKGNVIATALAGNPPPNLDTLESYKTNKMDVDLMVFNQADSMANELVASQSFVVTTPGYYSFSYTLSSSAFTAVVCDGIKVCYDCVYDLEIKLVQADSCNAVKYQEVQTINPLQPDPNGGLTVDDQCPKQNTNVSIDQNYTPNSFRMWLVEGSYIITKKLKVNPAATDAYVSHYIELFNDTCGIYDSLLQHFLNQVDSTMCEIQDTTKPLNRCEIAREAMLSDLSPGGQYGLINWSNYTASDPLSIFNTSNILPQNGSSTAHWMYPVTPYLDEEGKKDSIVNHLNQKVPPEQASDLEEFLEGWKSSWAPSLLEYHPEYCYYRWCDDDSLSFVFDVDLGSVHTYDEAVQKHFFSIQNNADIILSADPYFVSPGGGMTSYTGGSTPDTKMKDAINTAYYSSGSINMLRLAVLTAIQKYHYLQNLSLPATLTHADAWINNNLATYPNINYLPGLKDSIWINFRSMYLAKKEEFQYGERTHYAINNCLPDIGNHGGYNECIDTSFFNWQRNGYGIGNIISGSGPYFTPVLRQACNWKTYHLYSEKNIRFPGMYHLPVNFDPYGPPQDVHDNLAAWAGEMTSVLCDTCYCPNPEMTAFINWILDTLSLAVLNTNILLPSYPYIDKVKAMLAACNITITHINIDLVSSNLTISFIGYGVVYGSISMQLTTRTQPMWMLVDSIDCIQYDTTLGTATTKGFVHASASGPAHSIPIDVSLSFINNIKCPLLKPCPSKDHFCPPSVEARQLALLINTLVAKDSLHRKISIGTFAGSHIHAYFNPISTFNSITWDGQVSGNKITATVSSFQAQCSFVLEFPVGTVLPGYIQSLGAVLSLTPDPTQTDPVTGYTYHATLEVQVQSSNTPVIIKLKSSCFPFSHCGKCPPEISNGRITNKEKSGTKKVNRNEQRTRDPLLPAPVNPIDIEAVAILDPSKPCYPCDTLGFVLDYDSLTTDSTSVMIHKPPPHDLCDPCKWPTDTIPWIAIPNPCIEEQILAAYANAHYTYQQYLDSLEASIRNAYVLRCMGAKETFRKAYTDALHHFTLYYFDQAGNLLKTIPPEGVHQLNSVQTATAIQVMKNKSGNPVAPNHEMPSDYVYNSLNQLRKQTIPDHDGETVFFYDYLSQIVVSQNPEQRKYSRYSYTLYDDLNRPYETGELTNVTTPMTPVLAKNVTQLPAWIAANTKHEVTRTQYDEPLLTGNPVFSGRNGNYRDRIASVSYKELGGSAVENSTYYLYDIHGNVKELVQDVFELGKKRMSYDYDLISGNVKNVYYQQGEVDQFLHRYEYDADNRITNVFTSFDGKVWDHDAHYMYYAHGPLARTELGEHKVQGLDYAYTIQGWIKGVNSGVLNPKVDIGNDGVNGHPHGVVAQDAFGYMLRYFTSDYKMIGNTASGLSWEPAYQGTGYHRPNRDLFNGNIQSMITALNEPVNSKDKIDPLGYAYTYDQLNRITGMEAHEHLDLIQNTWVGSNTTQEYKESYTYDANGNILTLNRNGASSIAVGMDNFDYSYLSINGLRSNQLGHVDDKPSFTGNYSDDIDDQVPGNYRYDAIGNLISDQSEDLNISWNVSGKVSRIKKPAASEAIDFEYDPTGKRVIKRLTNGLLNTVKSTFYILDATGNVMAIYKRDEAPVAKGDIFWESAFVYGSSRIGEERIDTSMTALVNIQNNSNSKWYSFRNRGSKYFELGNHLGNVLVTMSDRRLQFDVNGDGGVDEYKADVWAVNDYYPFGSPIPERNFKASNQYRFGFNGKESFGLAKNQNFFDYGFRIYNSSLGKFLSIDPLSKNYPWNSPFSFAENDVIRCLDLDGLEKYIVVRQFYNNINYKTSMVKVNTDDRVYGDNTILVINLAHSNNGSITLGQLKNRQFRRNLINSAGSSQIKPIVNLTSNEKQIAERKLDTYREGEIAYKQVVLPTIEVQFGADATNFQGNLTDAEKTNLANMAALVSAPDIQAKINIVGYASAKDTRYGTGELNAENNMQLSIDRANAARDYLINELGVSGDKIISTGVGTERPKDTANPASAENQRVTVSLILEDF